MCYTATVPRECPPGSGDGWRRAEHRSNVKDIQKRLSNSAYKQVRAGGLGPHHTRKARGSRNPGQIKGAFAHPKPFGGRLGGRERRYEANADSHKDLHPSGHCGSTCSHTKKAVCRRDPQVAHYSTPRTSSSLTSAGRSRVPRWPGSRHDRTSSLVQSRRRRNAFQRRAAAALPYVAPEQKVAGRGAPRGRNTTDKLKLLIRFGDALPVKKAACTGATRRRRSSSRGFVQALPESMARPLATAR